MENKITFEDIQKANETIQTTDIKGKDYAEVNQRIKAFRMVYPTGTINTEMVSNDNGVCIFRANVSDGEKLIATGTAYEKENSTFINKTSYIENCETSAVGRALGMAGFGIDTSVASAEEVQNAIANQEPKKKTTKKEEITPYDFDEQMSDEQLKIITDLTPEYKEKLRNHYKKDPTTLTKKEAEETINSLKKRGLIKTAKELEKEKKEKEEVF